MLALAMEKFCLHGLILVFKVTGRWEMSGLLISALLIKCSMVVDGFDPGRRIVKRAEISTHRPYTICK